jgi:cell filamentation protein
MTGVDPYVDDNGVFLNNLGLTSADLLARAEADLSLAALLRLSVRPLPGSYDLVRPL